MDQEQVNRQRILLVEDHPDDEFLTLHTLRKNRFENVVVARDAQEALDYLIEAVGSENAPHLLPVFILLDLRLPKMDGFEFLETVRADERTRDIPIIVLSSSQLPSDVERCRNLGAAAYLSKPLDGDKLAGAMEILENKGSFSTDNFG